MVPDLVLRKIFEIAGWMLAIFGICTAILIIGGGEERWEGEAFQIAMKLPGSPDTWGWLLFVPSILLAFGMAMEIVADRMDGHEDHERAARTSRHAIGIGCSACGLWCFSIGTTFLCQLIADGDQVGNIGFMVWYFVGIWYMLRAVASLKILHQ